MAKKTPAKEPVDTADKAADATDRHEDHDRTEIPEPDPHEDPDDDDLGGRFSRFTRRLMEPGDGRKVLSAMWETSDRAKTEAVRMVAREVRSYLDALDLKEDVLELVRGHSLEINASLRLKPLAPKPDGDDDDGSR